MWHPRDLQARLRLADVVEKEDVNEAMRLMEMSKDSLATSQEPGRSVTVSYLTLGFFVCLSLIYFGRSSAVRPTLQTFAPIQSSTSFSQYVRNNLIFAF